MNADTRMGHTSLEGASHNYANEPITLADHSEVLWFILKDMRFCTMAKFWQKKKSINMNLSLKQCTA